MENKIKFICRAVKWFDKVNGNTYHSVRITRCEDGITIVPKIPYEYGYGDQYCYTALNCMLENGWLPAKYGEEQKNGGNLVGMYERENNYPIYWDCSSGLKREMIDNGTL